MKLKNGFEMHDVCGEKVLIAQGVENLDFTHLINLNESAAFLWRTFLGKEFQPEDMANALCKEYEVDASTALKDCLALIHDWEKQGLLSK
jgi:hypothetical protein